MTYKQRHSFDERLNEATKILELCPDKIPVIIEKHIHSTIADIDKHKYLMHKNVPFGQIVHIVRKKLSLDPNVAIFIFVNNVLPSTGVIVSQLYEDNKDSDGFLYMTYSSEETFG